MMEVERNERLLERRQRTLPGPGRVALADGGVVALDLLDEVRLITNLVRDGGFEQGNETQFWSLDSAAFGTPLCNVFDCPNDPGSRKGALPGVDSDPGGYRWPAPVKPIIDQSSISRQIHQVSNRKTAL